MPSIGVRHIEHKGRPRLLLVCQHVPPKGFQAVRYYGLYANAYKTLREQAKTESTAQAGEGVAAACTSYRKAGHCPDCHVEMALVDIYFGPGLHKMPKDRFTAQTAAQPRPENGHENWQRLPRAG